MYDFVKSNGTIALVQEVSSCRYLVVDRRTDEVLKRACDKDTGARAYDRILKVSRTIADLDNSEVIKGEYVAEALQYRTLDRKYWGTD